MAAGTKPTPWALSHKDEERERAITSIPYADAQGHAAERDARWHTARLIRRRYRRPDSWLDCLGLMDVPHAPGAWCTCRPGDGEAAR